MNLNKYKVDFKEHPQRTSKRICKQNVLISFNYDDTVEQEIRSKDQAILEIFHEK